MKLEDRGEKKKIFKDAEENGGVVIMVVIWEEGVSSVGEWVILF